MSDIKLCQWLFDEAVAIAPQDGSLEALEFEVEVAREGLSFMEDKKCGFTVNDNSNNPAFSCDKNRVYCPLRHVLEI